MDYYEGLQKQLMDKYMETASGNALASPQGISSILGLSKWGFGFSILYSIIGYIYFRKGRKESDIPKLIAGISLLAYPIFVKDTAMLIGIGALLVFSPILLNIRKKS
ncbi:MAG: hypothetical protein ACI9BD_000177 [Candidatus Marinamargulisbacteria bacterium]|jgi:hypothetical protein